MRYLVIIAGLALLALAAPAAPALACTPPPGGLPRLAPADRAALAEIVVHGTVQRVADSGIPGETATIAVLAYLKGAGPASITISGFGPSSLCRSPVFAGDELIFYAAADGAGGWRASYASQFDAVDTADPATLAALQAAIGQEPLVPAGGPAAPPPPEPWPGPLTYLGLGLLLLAAAMTIAARLRRKG